MTATKEKKDPERIAAALADVTRREHERRAGERENERLIAERDVAVRAAAEVGASYSQIADAMGVHRSRIGQILGAAR